MKKLTSLIIATTLLCTTQAFASISAVKNTWDHKTMSYQGKIEAVTYDAKHKEISIIVIAGPNNTVDQLEFKINGDDLAFGNSLYAMLHKGAIFEMNNDNTVSNVVFM